MIIPKWTGKYLGIPYRADGYDHAGCHCWGLVWLVYRDELGITLNRYAGIPHDDLLGVARAMKDRSCDPWQEVQRPFREFDVVLFRDSHLGLAINAAQLLHVEDGSETVIARLDDPRIAGRLLKCGGRHRLLANQITFSAIGLRAFAPDIETT
jgi:lipoprotein Spr